MEPVNLAFGQENVGSTSTPQTVAFSNTGNASLSVSSFAFGGTNAGEFAQTNNCASTVAPGASCHLNVTFTPAAVGSRSALLAITDNASDSPQNVSLTGTGVQPLVILTPSSVSFGPEALVTESAPQIVPLSNTGNSSVSISNIIIGGTNASFFGQSNNCGTSVGAGATCAISVIFMPYVTGPLSAVLNVFDNSIGSPQSAKLTGSGFTAPSTYSFNVNATSGNDTHSVLLSVTVQ